MRSGKTFCLSLSFVGWAFYRFKSTSFAMCGKTVTSLRRNVIAPLVSVLGRLGFTCREQVSKSYMDIEFGGVKNRFYFFGGKDEGSAALIQGITLGGVLFDEVALMPRSFVEQALARCSLAGSKFFFNCNPEYPRHWFYTDWIAKRHEKNALYLHFEMSDNPSLSPDILKRYQSLYSGVFYERFVKGLWTAPAGLVYPMFCGESHIKSLSPPFERYIVSCDYGTVNPCSFGLWGRRGDGGWHRLREYYYNSRSEGLQRTDEEHCDELYRLCEGFDVEKVIIDPSAASFIESVRRRGGLRVVKAQNDVLNGIRRVCTALKKNLISFSPECKDSLREFSLYRWDEGAGRDIPLKENDHAMDDIRYFAAEVFGRGDDDDSFFVLSQLRCN